MDLLLVFAAISAIAIGMIFLAAKRGLQMRELCEHGVETAGVIFSKRSVAAGKSTARRWKLVYRYQDSSGASHEHTSIVTIEGYQNHEQGGPIQVVYSAKNPAVSAPKFLVDQCRAALAKK